MVLAYECESSGAGQLKDRLENKRIHTKKQAEGTQVGVIAHDQLTARDCLNTDQSGFSIAQGCKCMMTLFLLLREDGYM